MLNSLAGTSVTGTTDTTHTFVVGVVSEVPCSAEAACLTVDDSAALKESKVERAWPTVAVWGLPFLKVTTADSVNWIEDLVTVGEPGYVITANLNWVMLSHEVPGTEAINRDAAGLLADGMPIVWRSRLQKREQRLPERVAGSELIYLLAERAAQRGWGIYLLGGAPGVADLAAERLVEKYPGLRISGIESPPFRPLSEAERQEQIQRIRDSNTQLLFVAFGQPKGEQWIYEHYQQLGVPVSIQLGASFDFIAGVAKRAPKIYQRLGLEWAYRMFGDPRRLGPRYWKNIKFLVKLLTSGNA